jgi:dihydropteroate synthase
MGWPLGGPQPTDQGTWVMGILNLTPDSFSDGGRLPNPEAAARQARWMLRDGAAVLDLGAQSTRPGAVEVGAREELHRLLPALDAIRACHPKAVISIDTFHAEVAEVALTRGANWINDVSGGHRDPRILHVVAQAGCPYVLMHRRGDSRTMDQLAVYCDVVAEVREELLRSTDCALAAGVKPEQLIWDPGLGFAKTTQHNLDLLRRLSELSQEGFPLLLGPSRKRFIGAVLNESHPRARVWGTTAVCSLAIQAGVNGLRVHDVRPAVQTARMADAILGTVSYC